MEQTLSRRSGVLVLVRPGEKGEGVPGRKGEAEGTAGERRGGRGGTE